MTADHQALPDGAQLNAPLAKLLRALVRLLIKAGMTFPAFCDLLKELYINVAENDFVLPDKRQTDSRVSLLTGIHRKEVARLRGAGAPIALAPASVSRSSQILALWLGSPAFTDPRGAPLPLFRSEDLGSPSFDLLVSSVTKDVRPRAVFDDWLDSNRIAIDQDDRIILLASALTPSSGDDQLYYFGRNLHDHMAAAVANITDNAQPFLERAVHCDGLSPENAAALVEFSRKQANHMLLEANRQALAICDADGGGDKRWTIGVYVYCADEHKVAPLLAEQGEPRRPKARSGPPPQPISPDALSQ
jgi:hypothetical protein